MDLAMIGEMLENMNEEYKQATVEDRFSLLPEGNYQAKILKMGFDETKGKGTPYLYWNLEITKAVRPDRTEDLELVGVKAQKVSYITSKTLSYLKGDIMACGLFAEIKDWPDKVDADGNIIKQGAIHQLVGIDVNFYCNLKTDDQGRQSNNYFNIEKSFVKEVPKREETKAVAAGASNWTNVESKPEEDIPF